MDFETAFFFLGLAAEIGEFQANQQTLKSLVNRIARAKRNIPATANLPYGGTFDRKTETWDIDEEKKKNIEWAAKRFLAGESMYDISAALGMTKANQ